MKELITSHNSVSDLFSNLETDILSILWKRGEGKSKILYTILGEKHGVTHSSVAVTLSRLYQKGILKRKPERAKGGIRFIYYPKFTKEELGSHIASNFLKFLRKNFGEACVANFRKDIK